MEGFKHYTSNSIQHSRKYHVFLSFRGADIRKSLVDHLVQSLSAAGLHVFVDSKELKKGHNIELSLQEAIKDSTIHIPIFTANYARSAWCLKELSLMWSCKSTCAGTRIIPLFHNMEPWQVRYPRNEKSPYAEAFKKHYDKERHGQEEIAAWRTALYEVSSLSGWSSAETADGYETKLVKHIVKDLLQTLNIQSLHVADYPVGLRARTEELAKMLKMDNNHRRLIIGIYGMGGVGKTTLLKAIYNEIHQMYEKSCFVSEIRARAKESVAGLRKLQKQILTNLGPNVEMELYSIDHGKIQMKNHLASLRALVILDDVDDKKQFDALVGDWYGAGSRIIIATRDASVLSHRLVDDKYDMRFLDQDESKKLFSWHAFPSGWSEKGYENMTDKIVKACRGLPMSLEILGAHLDGERDIKIWKETLQKVQDIDFSDLYESLKISYDALPTEDREIFLDIACFFINFGEYSYPQTKEFYIKFWEVLGCKAVNTSLKNLERKCLLVINEYNSDDCKRIWQFWMHDHIRDLGRRMGKCSRLWPKENIVTIITETEERPTMQGLMLNGVLYEINSLASMPKLKYMFCLHLILGRQITKLPPNLRYLVLSHCSLEQDKSFSRKDLQKKESRSSCSVDSSLLKTIGRLKFLHYLDMSGTKLIHLPSEVGELSSLEELYLQGCSLEELPYSFKNLTHLKVLDISHNNLTNLPPNFHQLISLLYLDARSNRFKELPALPGGLVNLNLRYCHNLQKIPCISHLNKLETLNLSYCKNLTQLPQLNCIKSLRELILHGCLELEELPCLPEGIINLDLSFCCSLPKLSSMSHLIKLESFDLSLCYSLSELPQLNCLQSLRKLKLDYCENLEELPLLPVGLVSLSLRECHKLKKMSSMSDMRYLETLDLSLCKSLSKLPNLDAMRSLTELTLDRCETLQELPPLPECTHVNITNCYKLSYP